MINQQLLTYITNQQEAGTDDATIKDNLSQAGWRDEDIEEGFQAVSGGDGADNSPAAHQEIRQEAAERRGGEEKTTTQSGQSAGDDPYKEPISEGDQSGIDNQADSREVSGNNSRDPQPTNPVADNSQNESQVTEQVSRRSMQTQGGDGEPMRVRTYERDKMIAQGQGDNLPESTAGLDDEKAIDPQKQVDELSKEVAASVDSHQRSREEAQQNRSKRKTPEEAAFEAREKRAQESERELDESGEELAQEGGMDSITMKRSEEAADSNDQPDKATQQSRQTASGRQRFSRNKDASAAKERLQQSAKQTRRPASGDESGSNIVSILLFTLAFIIVAGGAVYAYMTYYQTPDPETTAAQVVQSLVASETFDFRITIQSASDTETQQQQIIEGAFDLSQETPATSYYTLMDEQIQSPLRATMAEVENRGTVPDEQLETVQDILLSPQFFSVGEFQTTESLGAVGTSTGFTTNRYGVSMNPTQLVSDYATLHQAIFNTPLSQGVLSNLQATVSEFNPTRGQAWIDPDTGVPYQLTFLGTDVSGDDVQINFQFKNHGVPLESTPTYEPRSIEQVLDDYFAMSSTVDDEPEDSDDVVATSSATSSDETEVDQFAQARRMDQLRINDIQQIMIALRVYADNTGSFPASVDELTTSADAILTTIPQDPETGNTYSYSVSSDGDQYHLGATLLHLRRADTPGDTNFNSRGQGFPSGFNGAAAGCQISEADPAATCYDVTGSIE